MWTFWYLWNFHSSSTCHSLYWFPCLEEIRPRRNQIMESILFWHLETIHHSWVCSWSQSHPCWISLDHHRRWKWMCLVFCNLITWLHSLSWYCFPSFQTYRWYSCQIWHWDTEEWCLYWEECSTGWWWDWSRWVCWCANLVCSSPSLDHM